MVHYETFFIWIIAIFLDAFTCQYMILFSSSESETSDAEYIFEHNDIIFSFVVSTLNNPGVLLPYFASVDALPSTLNVRCNSWLSLGWKFYYLFHILASYVVWCFFQCYLLKMQNNYCLYPSQVAQNLVYQYIYQYNWYKLQHP